jgi:predicted metal-dependent hydrolase
MANQHNGEPESRGEKKTLQGILVRKVQFEFPQDFEPHWNPAKPELSQLANGTSILLPYMEPFIINAIRKAAKHITDPALLAEARAWMGQESQHFKQHRRFNEALIAKGYPQLREREQQIEKEYQELDKRSLKYQVAYTAGFEVMALAIAHTLIAQREYFFGEADPNVSSMWLWHLVEEIEHKNLAFEVYQHLYGGHWYRAYGLLCALIHMVGLIRPSYIALLKADGLWGKWKTRWAIKKLAFRLFASFLPRALRYALPGHHPSDVANPAWMREWVALYDKGEQGLTRLDTTKMQLSPEAMLPA